MCLCQDAWWHLFPVFPSIGVHIARKIGKIGMWSSDTAQVFFDDVRVPCKNIIGQEGMGFTYQMLQFQEERLFAAANSEWAFLLLLRRQLYFFLLHLSLSPLFFPTSHPYWKLHRLLYYAIISVSVYKNKGVQVTQFKPLIFFKVVVCFWFWVTSMHQYLLGQDLCETISEWHLQAITESDTDAW